jgi:hypothetical protein
MFTSSHVALHAFVKCTKAGVGCDGGGDGTRVTCTNARIYAICSQKISFMGHELTRQTPDGKKISYCDVT